MQAQMKWTFMVYMAGDNNLSAAGDRDLAEMRRVGSTNDVNIIAEFDNAGNLGTNRYQIRRGGVDDCVQALGETDSGDPKVLLDFIGWATERYPAERYALVLWNHGCGWQPLEIDKIARAVKAPDYSEREAVERSASSLGRAFFRTTLEKILSIPSAQERAICSDDGTGHSLDTIELGKVLARAVELFGRPLDILGMDACLMSNLEVAYQARQYVKYIVASEESEPAAGWPYNDVLASLTANPDMATTELAAQIVDLYIKSYQGYSGAVTQAALNVAKVMDLTKPIDELASALTERMEEMQTVIWKAQRNSASFWHFTLWDLAHFCAQLEEQSEQRIGNEQTRTAVLKAARKVRTTLATGADKPVVAEAHQGTKVAHCGGITIYLPSLPNISRFYGDLDFAKQHSWPTMLKAYLEA